MSSTQSIELSDLGWNVFFEKHFKDNQIVDCVPGRISIEHNNFYRVFTSDGEFLAELSGGLRHDANGSQDLPAVGDWVAIKINDNQTGTIKAVLPRKNNFSRKAAGNPTERQIIVANIDTVFLVSGLDGDFNLRRLERYLVAAAQSSVTPVIILNKSDLCKSLDETLLAVQSIALDVNVHTTSCLKDMGIDPLKSYLNKGKTVAFLGSSGVGKSTIINRLLGFNKQATQQVRKRDQKGRHTTVSRQLLIRSQGGLIIDTPGMRELKLWDTTDALEETFSDINSLQSNCRFRDCQHDSEPGCAVQEAVKTGRLLSDRLHHYHRLEKERAALEKKREEQKQAIENHQNKRTEHSPRRSRRLSYD
tara:strand:+ start:68658 stop:69743 length:1086 start_codon:yes stop_codon:yes gene_type:complete